MRTRIPAALIILLLILLAPIASYAQGKFTPPDVKEGLWEVTVTRPGSGMGIGGIPPEALASMTPDQRAKIEAAMKKNGVSSNGNNTVVKNCVTKDKVAKGMAFSASAQMRENCTRDVVSSSIHHMEIKTHCEDNRNGQKTIMDGTVTVDVVSPDLVKGSMHMVASGDQHLTMDNTFTSKYLGADCGDIK